ncbi:hypothetical protein LAD12857_36120 [Lacrimispora amygdalina]|uniref:Signal peptidase I n=1 Tax=Lacrimispora amygdalina TaxID=253257 RepID=A0A3E2N981_9FIRM|nr:DUF5684 domain-containing protein [Clostridium indicum]RFZ77568.1 hypothetical protein DS742_17800 [Clostridium indicum]
MDSSFYAAFAAFGMIIILIGLAIFILLLAAEWKIFSKAGKPGWAALIPIYNIYVRSNVAFGNMVYFIAFLVIAVINFIGKTSEVGGLNSLGALCTLILHIVYCINISKAFGKSAGFTVGLILLPVIFFPILAFGRDEYIGPQKI